MRDRDFVTSRWKFGAVLVQSLLLFLLLVLPVRAETPNSVSNAASPGSSSGAQQGASRKERSGGYGESVAVVEIFLTESSIRSRVPSETAFRLERKSRVSEDRLFTLVYHVDYLNDRGWHDPYSKPEFTERQRTYSMHMKHPRAEPDMAVINGAVYSPASQFDLIMFNVNRELKKRPKLGLQVKKHYDAATRTVTLDFTVPGAKRMRRKLLEFRAALIEDDILSTVHGGTNKDFTFRHTNVVRHIEVERFEKDGVGKLDMVLPEILEKKKAGIIYFIQDPETLEIWQAGRFALKDLL